jgi:hypothetical protein
MINKILNALGLITKKRALKILLLITTSGTKAIQQYAKKDFNVPANPEAIAIDINNNICNFKGMVKLKKLIAFKAEETGTLTTWEEIEKLIS